ncbi:MAG: hypothetical protein Q4B81_02020 [Moraxella sp.]|nr:hypothetical protein [Moraxella sp.]
MWQTITDFLSAIMTAFYSYQKDAMIDRPFVKLDFALLSLVGQIIICPNCFIGRKIYPATQHPI